jgi:hypothetical protein
MLRYTCMHLKRFLCAQAPFTERIRPVRVSGARGAKDGAQIVSLSVLAESRLLVIGSEDGCVKVCS